jgi:thiol-disulfide isomerase/thioredoxin
MGNVLRFLLDTRLVRRNVCLMTRLGTCEKDPSVSHSRVHDYQSWVGAVLSLGLMLGALVADPSMAGSAPKINSVALSGIRFAAPERSHEREYLGLSSEREFGLAQVKARVVLVEIFSMYCPICQAEASRVNELYRMVQSDENLRDAVKFVGVGAGNTPFEVDLFRKKFSVPFPLLADDDFVLQKAASEPFKTPTFLTLSVRSDKALRVTGLHVGAIKDPKAFFKILADAATADEQ